MNPKKIELVLALMEARQVSFLKSSHGNFYYFCHGVTCNKCTQRWFCEKHFSCNAPSVNIDEYKRLRDLKPEMFI